MNHSKRLMKIKQNEITPEKHKPKKAKTFQKLSNKGFIFN